MAWKKLTIDDLRLILSEDETQKLNELSLDSSVTAVINQTIQLVSATWRGALKAKGMTIDPRDYYVPSSYWFWILVHSRYSCWARFPWASAIALDEARKAEYDKAIELLKDPYIDPDPVDDSDPELSGYSPSTGSSILVPVQRFPTDLPCWKDWSLPQWEMQ